MGHTEALLAPSEGAHRSQCLIVASNLHDICMSLSSFRSDSLPVVVSHQANKWTDMRHVYVNGN